MKAVVQVKLDFEMRIYPGAGHAFFDDTSPQVYHEATAHESWDRVLRVLPPDAGGLAPKQEALLATPGRMICQGRCRGGLAAIPA